MTFYHGTNQKQNDHISAYTQPTHLIFGTVIDIANVLYHAKNQVGGLCVGGVRIQPEDLHHPVVNRVTYHALQKSIKKVGIGFTQISKIVKKRKVKKNVMKRGLYKIYIEGSNFYRIWCN